MFRRVFVGSACLALAACFVGCSGGGGGDYPDTVAAKGTVTYNGSLVEDASVVFSPASGDDAAYGTTDAQGVFTLKTSWGADGAVPGSYKVTVSKTGDGVGEAVEVDAEDEEADMMADEGTEEAAKITEHLPEKYKYADSTDLEEEVKADGDNNFKLELTDD